MKRFIALVIMVIWLFSGVAFGITGNSGSANKGFGYYIKKVYYSPDSSYLVVEGFFVNSTNDVVSKVNTLRLNINGRDGYVIAQAVSGGSLNQINLKPGESKKWNFLLASPNVGKDLSRFDYNVDYDYDVSESIKMSGGIKVFYKGEEIQYDVPPSVIDSRTLIPARLTFEKMGATVDWDAASKTVTVSRWGKVIKIREGGKDMYVNDQKMVLDVPAQVIKGRTLIPLRAVASALDCTINWGDEDKMIVIVEGY